MAKTRASAAARKAGCAHGIARLIVQAAKEHVGRRLGSARSSMISAVSGSILNRLEFGIDARQLTQSIPIRRVCLIREIQPQRFFLGSRLLRDL